MLQALTGKPSFKNAKDLYTWCQTGEGYPDQLLQDLEVSEGAIDFLHSVMACDPATRPTAQFACEHRWWAEPDIRPRKEQPASIIRRSGRISRRSAQDVRYPVEVSDARQRFRRPQSYFGHGTWNSEALPYPKAPFDNPFWTASGPSTPHIYPIGMYQHPYATSATHLPMSLYAPPHQRHSESDYLVNTNSTLDRRTHANELSYDSRSSNAPYHWPDVLQQQEDPRQRRAQIASVSLNGPHKPQQRDMDLLKQVRFEPGLRDRAQASPEQGTDREGRAHIIPAQRKVSVPNTKGLRRSLTLGDLTIDTNSHQNVQILFNPVNKNPKKRPQSSQVFGQAATPGASFGESGRGTANIESFPRMGQTVQIKNADAQLRDAIDQLSQKEAEIFELENIVARLPDKKGNRYYRSGIAMKKGEAGLLRETVDRLRDEMNENAPYGQVPARAVTWQSSQAGTTSREPRTGGEDFENRGEQSWPWLGDGGWAEELPAREDVRQPHVGLEAR